VNKVSTIIWPSANYYLFITQPVAYSGFQVRGREISIQRPRGSRPKGRTAEMGFLAGGSQPPPHQLGGLESAVSGVQGRAPVTKRFYHIRSTQRGLSWHISGVIATKDRKSQEHSCLLPKIAYLRPVPLSHSVEHCTGRNCAQFSIDFARITCVEFVTHNQCRIKTLEALVHWEK